MPIVKCPNCGRERLVVEGKKKKCRKCGTPLTANMGKPATPDEELSVPEEEVRHDDMVDDTVDETVDEPVDTELAALNRKQLRVKAKELGIKIPFTITNKGICKLIRDKLA